MDKIVWTCYFCNKKIEQDYCQCREATSYFDSYNTITWSTDQDLVIGSLEPLKEGEEPRTGNDKQNS